MINFFSFCNVFKSQCINASCHYALCCVIIMNPMIHIYFIRVGKIKIICTRGYHVFGFMVVVGVPKNINTLLMGE